MKAKIWANIVKKNYQGYQERIQNIAPKIVVFCKEEISQHFLNLRFRVLSQEEFPKKVYHTH